MAYSKAQMVALAKAVGLPDNAAKLFGEIGMAESSGDTTAVGHNSDGTTDTGLWQINSVHLSDHPTWTVAWLKNPGNNAQAMKILSNNGADTQPWNSSKHIWGSSYAANNYKGIGETAGLGNTGDNTVDIPIVSQVTDAANTVTDATVNIGKGIVSVGGWIGNPRNWLRVAYVIAGTALVVGGAIVIAKPAISAASDVAMPVKSAVMKGVSK